MNYKKPVSHQKIILFILLFSCNKTGEMYIHSLYHLCVFFSADVHFMNYCSLYGNRKKSRFPRRCGKITLISLVLLFVSSAVHTPRIRRCDQVGWFSWLRFSLTYSRIQCHFATIRKELVNNYIRGDSFYNIKHLLFVISI